MNNTFSTITRAEFGLILKALEALPAVHSTGEMIADMIVRGANPNANLSEDHLKFKAKARKEREDLMEDIGVLRGKIIQIKRNLEMEGLLKDVDQIINPQ